MAIDEINPTPPLSVPLMANQEQHPLSPATSVAAQAATATPGTTFNNLAPAQQVALRFNETLMNLEFNPPNRPDPLLTNPAFATTLAGRNLTPAQQTAVVTNQALQNLVPNQAAATPPLLINETSPALEELLANTPLTPEQQTALHINQTLQLLTPQAATTTLPRTSAPAAAPVAPPPTNFNPTVPGAGAVNLSNSSAAAAPETGRITPASATSPAPTTTAISAAAIPAALFAPNLTTNPIAVGIYEIKNPKPQAAEPEPIGKELPPLLPIGRVRPVDRLVLRRAWRRQKFAGLPASLSGAIPPAERAIRQAIEQANNHLLANGLPLHLVLAKKEGGYALDLYDCSDPNLCRLLQDLPLDLKNLSVLLSNLQAETGIIVDTKT